MAYVYADMDALGTYQQDIVRVIGVLREEANSKEELVEATERTIREALDRAEEAEHMASASLQVAEEQLAEAEMRTREHNANLGEDEEPATTPEFYYDNVYEKQAQYDYAADVREDTQNILDEFRAYVRRYRQQQAAGIAEINKLVTSSGRFFAGYIKVLIEAKKCTAFSAGNDGKGSRTESGSSKARMASTGGGGKPGAIGWCPQNSMSAVHVDAAGNKMVSMRIAGTDYTYSCTMAGMQEAYNQAVRSGDNDMMARTSAMFEMEVIRDSLSLTNGDPSVPQLGGYHADVMTQDPPDYESHHIPARSVQAANAKRLPTISISQEDHKLTSSYAGKQNKTYGSFLPSAVPAMKYKASITAKLQQGSSGYVEAVRNELLDLRLQTGNRYDGGISAFLDATIDMIATTGIPEAKLGGKP